MLFHMHGLGSWDQTPDIVFKGPGYLPLVSHYVDLILSNIWYTPDNEPNSIMLSYFVFEMNQITIEWDKSYMHIEKLPIIYNIIRNI